MKKNRETTTIVVHWNTHDKLKNLKTHARQSFEEVIQHLLETSFDLATRYKMLKNPPLCAKCNQFMDFETWKKGGQGYCETCFYEVCAELKEAT